MSEESRYSFRVLTDEDRIGVMKLLGDTSKMSIEFWMWKYELNPDFDPSLARVAINNREVVGCAFWLPRNLKICNSISVRAALGADLAVYANHKGQGIGKALIASENEVLENKGMVMSYGFVLPELVMHIHGPQIGLVGVPTSTIVCKKYLDCSKVREKVQLMNLIVDSDQNTRAKLANLKINVLFRLRGQPQFVIKMSPDIIDVEEDDLACSDVKVKCDLTLLDLVQSKRRMFTLVKALLTRKMRISGSLRNIIKLYSILELIKLLFT